MTNTAPAARRLLYVVTEDWFFASHFLPMARAAIGDGFDVAVVCRVRAHRATLEAAGVRVIPLEADRATLNPFRVATAIQGLYRVMRRERPTLVHCIALRGIVTGGAAVNLAGIGPRVFAVTGEGLVGAHRGVGRRLLTLLVRRLAGPETIFLFENTDDPVAFGLDRSGRSRVRVVGGAGVDPLAFPATELPPMPPLRVAMVSRLIWSKGVDLAVAAVQAARAAGAPVELAIFGAPDPDNPKAVPEAQLRAWSALPGIGWHGRTDDAAAVWRTHHLACVPSRGGEGLPRTMLEAAASGRGLLTTDVAGCRSFVRDGVEGRVVPPDDAPALASAMVELARDPARLAAMGRAARARALAGHTEADVKRTISGLYRELVARGGEASRHGDPATAPTGTLSSARSPKREQ